MPRIAIDIESGDGPKGGIPAVQGAVQAIAKRPEIQVVLVGSKNTALRGLQVAGYNKDLGKKISIMETHSVVTMDMGIIAAMRCKESSMATAMDMLARRTVDSVISCGNTGGFVGWAAKKISYFAGVNNAYLMCYIPTRKYGVKLMTDAGAHPRMTPDQLAEAAILAGIHFQVKFGIVPTIGFLAIGKEGYKATPEVAKAREILASHGIVSCLDEPTSFLAENRTNVLVANAEAGNFFLKSLEAASVETGKRVKDRFLRGPYAKIVGLLARPVLSDLKSEIYPPSLAHSPLVGHDRVIFKIHGGCSDPDVFKHAIFDAADLVMNDTLGKFPALLLDTKPKE